MVVTVWSLTPISLTSQNRNNGDWLFTFSSQRSRSIIVVSLEQAMYNNYYLFHSMGV